jgi:hypothetical protein
MLFSAIPAKAGIQEKPGLLDPGVRRGDGFDDFLRVRQTYKSNITSPIPRSPVLSRIDLDDWCIHAFLLS